MNRFLSPRPLSRRELRGIDERAAKELNLPTLLLMENAGRGAAAWLADLAAPAVGGQVGGLPRILVLCGPGNNGGDGGVVARHLDAWGFPVRVVWFAARDRLSGDAASQHAILGASGIDQACWPEAHGEGEPSAAELDALVAGADWLVDGLLGTGLTRPVEGTLRRVVEAMNRSGKPAMALDLPSGLDADTGRPLGVAVRARATASFVAPKLGFGAEGASEYTGVVKVVDIGVPRRLLEGFLT
ncbi:Bifunctional NAD(P)H-hydrate repair enzyme Nnr [Aquisphaera giovannonii]|uniref:NAD(P)H-hydrate epimerase n=1 Tax=Aquisphaera giovannonii TaxID=406548 RepID=A0A5B9WF20_9BACT|nr:NAD(P)H-hydrate epimerase [Aquisphaera giovannonii]QEH39063.1 Bifunctional NAD(P)H-hydrate repair enzyme Nnr [Aquisphaera giovannonii]